ncbi:MAG: ribosome maturation factor RimP [Synergistaceae bacterium]|nr:ribosome maturation factor RimP [Synergistaceae bacterium]
MNKEKLGEVYKELSERINSSGYDCVGFELTAEDGVNILRVYIDMPGGVDLSDCEKAAREVNEYLDTVEDVLPERYFLEVSSPGLERPLFTPDDYRRFAGKEAQAVLKHGKKITGFIKDVEGDSVRISTGEGELTLPFAEIVRGKLIYKEQRGEKKTFKKIPAKKKK